MSEPLVALKNIGKNFKQSRVLDGVDLQINPLQIISLIGPNGAGKTTLVKIILGLIEPDEGQLVLHPELRIGYMPQRIHIDSTLPITLDRFLRLAEPDTTLCSAALEEVGIRQHLNSPLQSLSGGEMQRALLARAILRKPNFLVLDEPVQGVDIAGQEALYKLIGELRHRLSCAVLMVSHDLHLVMSATDEVVCLNQHVCCHGRPDQVTNNPEFVNLFGTITATYTHHHDHQHDLDGEVLQSNTITPSSKGCQHD